MSESDQFETDWEPGDGVLLTQPACPACLEFKEREDVKSALQDGVIEEVTPDHPDYDTILAQSGVAQTPAIVRYEADSGGFVEL